MATNKLYGSLVRIFDIVGHQEQSIETLRAAGLLFPPVFILFQECIRRKYWSMIGNFEVEAFAFPKFRCSQDITHGYKPGIYHDWLIWDGENYSFIGALPPELRELEYLVFWPVEMLQDRIVTGENVLFGGML